MDIRAGSAGTAARREPVTRPAFAELRRGREGGFIPGHGYVHDSVRRFQATGNPSGGRLAASIRRRAQRRYSASPYDRLGKCSSAIHPRTGRNLRPPPLAHGRLSCPGELQQRSPGHALSCSRALCPPRGRRRHSVWPAARGPTGPVVSVSGSPCRQRVNAGDRTVFALDFTPASVKISQLQPGLRPIGRI